MSIHDMALLSVMLMVTNIGSEASWRPEREKSRESLGHESVRYMSWDQNFANGPYVAPSQKQPFKLIAVRLCNLSP